MTEKPSRSRDSLSVGDILTEIREVSLNHKKKSAAECEKALEELCTELAESIMSSCAYECETHTS